MRTFVYDNYGCDLLRCMFAGLPKKLLEKYSKKRVY